jgi:hypothetical protein
MRRHVVRVHDSEQFQALSKVQVGQQLVDTLGELALVRGGGGRALWDSGVHGVLTS